MSLMIIAVWSQTVPLKPYAVCGKISGAYWQCLPVGLYGNTLPPGRPPPPPAFVSVIKVTCQKSHAGHRHVGRLL